MGKEPEVRALLIVNEKSRYGARDADLVRRTLAFAGIDSRGSLEGPDFDVVVAAGGDGTVVRTIPLAIARKVPLGIVPLGTFNDLAKTLGVPANVGDACAAIAAGRTRCIDVGTVNGVYFVNEASVGLSTRVARRQTTSVKRRFGALGVISTTLQSLAQARPFRVELQYGGTTEIFHSVQLTVANNARFGGIFERRDAAIDDGLLDLYSIEVQNWLQGIALISRIARRDPTTGKGLRTRRATSFTIRTRRAHHIAGDGEPAGMTPATFRVLPQAVNIVVP